MKTSDHTEYTKSVRGGGDTQKVLQWGQLQLKSRFGGGGGGESFALVIKTSSESLIPFGYPLAGSPPCLFEVEVEEGSMCIERKLLFYTIHGYSRYNLRLKGKC